MNSRAAQTLLVGRVFETPDLERNVQKIVEVKKNETRQMGLVIRSSFLDTYRGSEMRSSEEKCAQFCRSQKNCQTVTLNRIK